MADQLDLDALEAWLRKQPREASIAIASRAALRVMPLLADVLNKSSQEIASAVLLPLLIGMASARATARNPTRGKEYAAAAAYEASDAAAYVAEFAIAANAADAAADAAATAAAADTAAAAAGAAYVAAAATSAANTSTAFHSDYQRMKSRLSPHDLVQLPLWPDKVPDWARNEWVRLQSKLLDLDQDWDVWIAWYGGVLKGRPIVEELEFDCRLAIPEEYWSDAARMNAEINRRETEYWERRKQDQESQSETQETSPPDVPENKPAALEPDNAGQTPAFYRYRFDGLQFDVTYVAADLSVSKAMRDGALEALLETLHEFHKTLEKPSKTNAYLPTKLLDKLTVLSSLLSESDPNSGDYPARFRLLSASVKRLTITIFQEGGCGSKDIDDTLHDILDAIDGLKGCYREIAIIERETLKTEIRPDNAAAVVSNLKTLSDELAEVKGALTTSAQNSLHGVIDRAADDSASEELADIAVDQTLSNRNLSRVVAQEVRKQRKDLATEVVSQAKKAMAKALVENTASVLTLGMSRLLKFAPSLQEVIDRLASDKEDTAAVSEDDSDAYRDETFDV
ncbi:MAG: hypothetical protein ROO70_03640 [Labrenzia sp.]